MRRSRSHFEAGRALYDLGNYQDALREFTAGYQLYPNPKFLINLGQTYRKLGNLSKARDAFKGFLEKAHPSALEAQEVKQLLQKIEAELLRAPPPPQPPAQT